VRAVNGERGPDDVCTVDDAARHLRVHAKTVLRYIRDGRLRATRIGKSYRILRRDLDEFTGVAPAASEPVRVSTVVDIPGVAPELARKWAGAISNAIDAKPRDTTPFHAEVIHEPERRHLKVVIVGSAEDTMNLLGLIRVWTQQLTP
jgi:excisionase family DNA binding protein